MPGTRRVPKDRLASYFDVYTKEFLRGDRPRAVDVEVLEREFGDQLAVVGARLLGIAYDRDTEVLELEMDGGDHRISQPREVWIVEEQDGFLSAMQIVHSDDRRELVRVTRVGLRKI